MLFTYILETLHILTASLFTWDKLYHAGNGYVITRSRTGIACYTTNNKSRHVKDKYPQHTADTIYFYSMRCCCFVCDVIVKCLHRKGITPSGHVYTRLHLLNNHIITWRTMCDSFRDVYIVYMKLLLGKVYDYILLKTFIGTIRP